MLGEEEGAVRKLAFYINLEIDQNAEPSSPSFMIALAAAHFLLRAPQGA